MNLVALIKPKKKFYNEVMSLKKLVGKKFGNQTYLKHLPHITIFDLKISKSKITANHKNKIQIKHFKKSKLRLILKKRYFFKSDPITNKTTFVIFLKKTLILKAIQTKLLDRFKSIKLNKKFKFKDKNLTINSVKYGYPFVKKNWKPHLTIVSIDKKYSKDTIFTKFLNNKKKFYEYFEFVYFYEFYKNKHFFLWKSKVVNDN